MKKEGLFRRARLAARSFIVDSAPIAKIIAVSAFEEARKNVADQHREIKKDFAANYREASGLMDNLVFRPLERQAEIFDRVEHRKMIIAGLRGAVNGIANYWMTRQFSPRN